MVKYSDLPGFTVGAIFDSPQGNHGSIIQELVIYVCVNPREISPLSLRIPNGAFIALYQEIAVLFMAEMVYIRCPPALDFGRRLIYSL